MRIYTHTLHILLYTPMGPNLMTGVGVNSSITANTLLEIIFRANRTHLYLRWRPGLTVDSRTYSLNFNPFYDNDIMLFRRANRYNKNLEEFKLANNLLICYWTFVFTPYVTMNHLIDISCKRTSWNSLFFVIWIIIKWLASPHPHRFPDTLYWQQVDNFLHISIDPHFLPTFTPKLLTVKIK